MSLRKIKKMMLGTDKIKSSQVRRKVNQGLKERSVGMSPIVRRIYIATSFPRQKEANDLALSLVRDDTIIVSTWHEKDDKYADTPDQWKHRVLRDYKEVDSATILICLTGDERSHGGRHTEFGMALIKGISIVIIGPREQIFHYHPRVLQYDSVDQFMVMVLRKGK